MSKNKMSSKLILDSETDTDSIELLDLPHPNGIKARRQKPTKLKPKKTSCSLCTLLSITLVLLLTAAVVVIAIFTYNFSQQIKELRKKMEEMGESMKTREANMQSVSKDMLKTSFATTKTITDGIKADIDDILLKQKGLKKKMDELEEKKSNPAYMTDMLQKVTSLQTELANEKKNEESHHKEVTRLIDGLTQQVKIWQKKFEQLNQHSEGRTDNQLIKQELNKINEFSADLSKLNHTLLSKIENVQNSLNLYSKAFPRMNTLKKPLDELQLKMIKDEEKLSQMDIKALRRHLISTLMPVIRSLIKNSSKHDDHSDAETFYITDKIDQSRRETMDKFNRTFARINDIESRMLGLQRSVHVMRADITSLNNTLLLQRKGDLVPVSSESPTQNITDSLTGDTKRRRPETNG